MTNPEIGAAGTELANSASGSKVGAGESSMSLAKAARPEDKGRPGRYIYPKKPA